MPFPELPFLFKGHGTVWSQGDPFLGAQCVHWGPWWRLGMGGGCGLLLGGGFHIWHHQELWHLPPGPNEGVWRDQQSGLLDCFHLRVCHDLQWWVQLMRLSGCYPAKSNKAQTINWCYENYSLFFMGPQVLSPLWWLTALVSSLLLWLEDSLFPRVPLPPALPAQSIRCTSPMD